MYTFEPLRQHLADMGRTVNWLMGEVGFTTNVRGDLLHDRSVKLEIIAKICVYLDLPIEDVVRITKPSAP